MDPCNSLYNNATIRGYLKLVKTIEEGQAHDHYQVIYKKKELKRICIQDPKKKGLSP